MNLILAFGVILLFGFLGGAVASRFKCPRVTGYLVAGMILSPSVLQLLPKASLESLGMLNTAALGLIVYAVGGNLRLESMRNLAKSICWISLFQALLPCALSILLIVSLAPFIPELSGQTFIHTHLPLAVLLGAMACPTAPAITLAIAHECRAEGPMTSILMAVVAITDILSVILFGLATGICHSLVTGGAGFSFYQSVGLPFLEIFGSILLGCFSAWVLFFLLRYIKARVLFLVPVLGINLLCTGAGEFLGLSPLMANMVLGFLAANHSKGPEMLSAFEEIENVIFIMFFVLSAMHFDLTAMKAAGVLSLLIILGRWPGKYVGARIGAGIAGAPERVKKYIGLALLPKAGLVIGLAFLSKTQFPAFGDIILNSILATVIVNTLITPPLARYAISMFGEFREAG